ncbi:probable cyclic nucleotide-gated ion channel 10 [Mangifera indica]|uniref:probable cyclic nucleotide-gated ion channel 10 n=1 Tax=Mangifera indica TaxID=29780 RepID=UPI001CFB0271|nr:probable cyclic nucleotide-gated ion channel 10 [Mangifera indica]
MILFVYIFLLIGLSSTIRTAIANNSDGYVAKAKWGKAAINLILYCLGGHVFGALWYFFALKGVLACWRKDYFSRNHFNPHSVFCSYKHKNIGELNCPKLKNVGTEINDFGIFNLALESRIVYLRRDFGKRSLYGFRWGLQALSCFGQNLLPSTSVLENLFVISIIIYSTVLFALFIGNVETYLQFNGEEPKYIINRLRMKDRLQRLKDVQELNDWEDSKLDELCRRIKPVLYGKGTLIVREGEPISEVLFVLKGKLWTCTSTAADHGNGGNVKTFGKELVRWIQDHPQSISLPISSSTIKAVENVEAFALTAADLADVWVNIQNNHRMTTRSILQRCFQF